MAPLAIFECLIRPSAGLCHLPSYDGITRTNKLHGKYKYVKGTLDSLIALTQLTPDKHFPIGAYSRQRQQQETLSGAKHFCKAQTMIAERRIRLCKLLSSGESETIEIKTLQHHCVNLGRIGETF